MLMVTAVNPPMVQVQPLKINQQKAHQQRPKKLQAVLLVLLRPLKAKQTVPPPPDNYIPVKI